MNKKSKFFVLGILSMTFVIGAAIVGCSIDGEEGRTMNTANQLTHDNWFYGHLVYANSEQWFRFTASASTHYIHILFDTLSDLYIQLYDNNSNLVGNQNHFNSNTSYSPFTVTIGRVYYARVWSAGSSSGTYQIGFNSTPLPVGIYSSAITLNTGIWTDGNITSANREQWFKFKTTSNMLYLHAFFGTLTNLNIQFYNSNGSTLGNNINLNGSNSQTSLLATSEQIHYVKVTPHFSNDSGTYRIAFNTSIIAPDLY